MASGSVAKPTHAQRGAADCGQRGEVAGIFRTSQRMKAARPRRPPKLLNGTRSNGARSPTGHNDTAYSPTQSAAVPCVQATTAIVVVIAMMVTVSSCGWNHAADGDCADNAQRRNNCR